MADFSEDAILATVASTIQGGITISGRPLSPDQVTIEFDEGPPAGVRDIHIMVIPAGASKGEAQSGILGTGYDKVWSVKVTVVAKINVPADRVGNYTYMAVNSGINAWIGAIEDLIHGNYTVMNSANAYLSSREPTVAGFHTPLEFERYEGPAAVGAEYFGHEPFQNPISVGIKKSIVFGGMRRTKLIP